MGTVADKSYLLRRQQDGGRLRRMALEEFVIARNSGRMVAFVGSYASRHLGYPNWEGAVRAFLRGCKGADRGILDRLSQSLRRPDERFPAVDIMDLAELLADRDRHASKEKFEDGRKDFAGENFALLGRVKDASARPRIAEALFSLGISRAVTLNYDLELEWEAFLTEHERETRTDEPRRKLWEELVLDKREPARLIERHVPALGNVASDVLERGDSAQLIEFGVGPPGDRYQILHLHGRCDIPEGMLVTRRDYRDRYWQSGFSKLPFEYGLRLIFTGNPILFVGVGMTEGEVTRTLEQLLSDNPNRRTVPLFLLWNSSDDSDPDRARERDDMTRLLFNRKFGAHVLFDFEIAEQRMSRKDYGARIAMPFARHRGDRLGLLPPKSQRNARRLEEPLRLLRKIADAERLKGGWTLDDFRTPQAKYDSAGVRVNMWRHHRGEVALVRKSTDASPEVSGAAARSHLVAALSNDRPIKAIIGGPGSRRGAVASAVADAYEEAYLFALGQKRPGGRVVAINGSFVTETDSIFGIVSGAYDDRTAQFEEKSRTDAALDLTGKIEADFASWAPPADPKASSELTIVINSMERFIAHDGSTLSTELDAMIRLIARLEEKLRDDTSNKLRSFQVSGLSKPPQPAKVPKFPVRLILIGTPRLRRYLSVIAPQTEFIELEPSKDDTYSSFKVGQCIFSIRDDCYFKQLARAFKLPATTFAPLPARRQAFLAIVFDRAILAGNGIDDPELAFEVLKVLAFIGQPTEEHVLYHAPNLWDEEEITPARIESIQRAVRQLVKKKLILKLDAFPSNPSRKGVRLGLHKAVVAEIRQRYGVPVSDARLASGFNIGLYTAHPLDSFIPDQRWHRDIGKIVDFLAGQFRDRLDVAPAILAAAQAAKAKIAADKDIPHYLKRLTGEELGRLAQPVMSDCLRAALSLMRSYYSTPALLMYCNRDLDPWSRDGPLTEHAERLTRLIRVSREVAAIRRLVLAELEAQGTARPATVGAPPFYPDDLVWLYNELGVVRITQGSLHEARSALEEALRLNDQYVEFGKRYQNWRRISLNLIQVEIDSGEIEVAEEKLRDIESSVEEFATLFGDLPLQRSDVKTDMFHTSFRDYAIAHYAHGACSARTTRIDRHYPTDLILTVALVLGHRGLCQHLRGALEPARESFRDSIAILERLNEQRAYAFFQRHSAALYFASEQLAPAQQALRLCVAAAGPSKQTDIDHAGRIALSPSGILIPTTDDKETMRTKVIPQLLETLRYATTSDMFRLQLEAMQNMALVHLRNGDADSAMQFATDALAIATRCGFGLRQVSLRIVIGRILAFQSDRPSAKKLLLRASRIAAGLHYERAVETAEDALVQLGELHV